MSGSRRSLLLLVALAGPACTGRVETPPAAPAASAPGGAPGATAAVPLPPDPADVLAATLTEDKLKRLLAVEEEVLPISASLVAVASLPGAGRRDAPGEPTPEERTRSLQAQIDVALARRGLTRADRAGFAALSGGLVQQSAKAAEARELLARNDAAKKALARLHAEEARKKQDPRRPRGPDPIRPLPEAGEQQLQVQVVQADADRKAFAARHGEAVLALLDRYQPQILAVREKQVRAILGASSSR